MRALISVILVVFSSVDVTANQGVALRTSSNYDSFSKCSVLESIGLTDVFSFNSLLYSKPMEGTGPIRLAYLYFSVKTKNGGDLVLRLTFKTDDPEGWILIQGENGEIFPFSKSVNSKVILLDPKTGSVLGSRDISRCFI